MENQDVHHPLPQYQLKQKLSDSVAVCQRNSRSVTLYENYCKEKPPKEDDGSTEEEKTLDIQ